MELEVKSTKKKRQKQRIPSVTGFLSFIIAIFSLTGLNIALIMDYDEFPDFFLIKLPLVGLILGGIGLFTQKRSRLFSIWGILICLFIYIFTFLMFGLAWSINPKP
ncbi:hypothetical protein [Cytobacillus massiliigabonensis]|uniref:hypothetical protein n=1 Tax=Cytobacillus massiliigabonensis TaxID=1871011 RepID=UPI000C84374E|nr:hypothetical protein [Cytobacillus massiliigabonensis]